VLHDYLLVLSSAGQEFDTLFAADVVSHATSEKNRIVVATSAVKGSYVA